MASGAAPDRLKSTHFQVAALDAAGYPNGEIARLVGFHVNRISAIKGSPLYQALLATERRRLAEALRENHVGKLEALAERAWEAKRVCLDQTDNLSVLNAAADSILDRLVPKKTEHEERREVVVRLSVEDSVRIQRTLAEDPEDGGVDVTPARLTPLAEAILDATPLEDEPDDAMAS